MTKQNTEEHSASAAYHYIIATYTNDFEAHQEHARRSSYAKKRFYNTTLDELKIIDQNAADNFAVRYQSLDDKLDI